MATLLCVAVMSFVAEWLGGPPERYGSRLIIALYVVQLAAAKLFERHFATLDLIGLFVDIAAFAGLTAIALYAWRIWPIWASALQLLALAAHAVRAFDLRVEPLVYGVMKSGPTYFAMLAIIIGALAHRRRMRIAGNDPSWRSWSGPSRH